MIGAKFEKNGHVTLTTPILGVVCYRRLGFDTFYLHAKFDVPEISLGASKFKVGHVSLTTPLL